MDFRTAFGEKRKEKRGFETKYERLKKKDKDKE